MHLMIAVLSRWLSTAARNRRYRCWAAGNAATAVNADIVAADATTYPAAWCMVQE